jgi:histone-lysine N-methyltransferase ASH1L
MPGEQDTAKLTARSPSKHRSETGSGSSSTSRETPLSGTTTTTACHGASSAVSDSSQTLVNDESVQELVSQGIGALNLDWTWKQSLPGKPAGATEEDPSKGATLAAVRRKSARLSLMVKAAGGGLAGKMSVLGKRSRQAVDAGIAAVDDVTKSLQRRTSQRLKAATARTPNKQEGGGDAAEEENAEEEGAPVRKKAKESSTANATPTVPPAEAKGEPPKSAQPVRKWWLSHGLYFRGDPEPIPKSNRTPKNASNTELGAEDAGSKILPMPILAGQRLIEHGRDFKLPFDIFAPLPVCQPKPQGWKKLQKSEFFP